MGKKKKALTSNKYNAKRKAWLAAVRTTEVLSEQVEEVISTVKETNKKVADKTSTIELVDPPKPAKSKSPIKAKKAVKKVSTNKTTTKTAKKATKE